MRLFETPRLFVRHLNPGDIDSMYSIFSNPAVTRWMGDGTALTRELCEKWIGVSLRNYETRGYGASAVIEKDTTSFIGCCGIVYDPQRQEPEIIYALQPNSWGKGLASELVPGMLQFGLKQYHLPYILATIHSDNTVSQRIAEKAGMDFISREIEPDGSVTLVYQIKNKPRAAI